MSTGRDHRGTDAVHRPGQCARQLGHHRVTTAEGFHRARFRYQLTPREETAKQALASYDEAHGSSRCATGRGIGRHRRPATGPPRAGATTGTDATKVHPLRSLVDVVTTGGEIATLLGALDDADVARLLLVAAPPEADGAGDDDPSQRDFEHGPTAWQQRWRLGAVVRLPTTAPQPGLAAGSRGPAPRSHSCSGVRLRTDNCASSGRSHTPGPPRVRPAHPSRLTRPTNHPWSRIGAAWSRRGAKCRPLQCPQRQAGTLDMI